MIQTNVSLKNYNTFGIDVSSAFFSEITSEDHLISLLHDLKNKPFRVLGGGSNVLLTANYEGHTLIMKNKGIEIVEETDEEVAVEIQAGVDWHELVLWSLEQDYGGIENLALIPGSVGAAPIQNIGAYGVELKSVFQSCRGIDLETLTHKVFYKEECEFGYRTSIFKTRLKGKIILTAITLRLKKKPHQTKTNYGALQDALEGKKHTIQNVAAAVMDIRSSKLPDPNKIGNSGSFFKNPILSLELFEEIQKRFKKIPFYPEGKDRVKIPAGWLIEKLGFKGKRVGNVGCHEKQALVLVNYGEATGTEVLKHAELIQKEVLKNFNIPLEMEVNLL